MRIRTFPSNMSESPCPDFAAEPQFNENQQYTLECLAAEEHTLDHIQLQVILPPLFHENRFVRGLYYGNGTEAIASEGTERYKDFYYAIADSHWSSYPWSRHSQASFSLYPNPEYQHWYQDRWWPKMHGSKPSPRLIPLQQADDTHEMQFIPNHETEKNIEMLCISHYQPGGQLVMVAKALKAYRARYPDEKPFKLYLYTQHDYDMNFACLNDMEMETFRKIQEVLIHPRDYIHFVKGTLQSQELVHLLQRSKAYLNPKLLGEKGQYMPEAMCCNVPVLCFEEFNKTVRGTTPAIPEGAGITCDYAVDSLVEAIHHIRQSTGQFTPRMSYLQHHGRKAFFNQCMMAFSEEYAPVVPDFNQFSPSEHYWLDAAMRSNYQISLHDYLMGHMRQFAPFRFTGLGQIKEHFLQLDQHFTPLLNPQPATP